MNVIFDIDWQGTQQIKEQELNYKLLTFFILPPSKKILLSRLAERENNNEKVDLPKEFLMVLSDKHTIKLPELGSGKYKTDWRAMASDGHVIKGKFTFEIY